MIVTPLASTARALVPSGRGILAADESHPSIEKRFSALGIENTVETRRVYRQMLFTTPGVAAFISGVILFDETIRQKADDGRPLGDLLALRGMMPRIKVDTGGDAPPAALVLVQPRAAGRGPEGLEGRPGPPRCRPERLPPPRPAQRPRPLRPV
jgi:fructose-bisphosphate aldolase class 1